MRILYLTHNITWKGGGIYFTAYHQARHLVTRGHDVTLLSISPSARWKFYEYVSAGVRIVETPDWLWGRGRSGWDLWDITRRIVYLHDAMYDLVHGFESRPVVALPALYLRHFRNIPLIFTWADWFGRGGKGSERSKTIRWLMEPLETFCEDYFMPKADRCIAMGDPFVKRALSLGVSRERILNLLHGCDPEQISPIAVSVARSKLNQFTPDTFILGYLGALRPSSAKLMFDTFRILRQRITSECKMVLIGNTKLEIKEYLSPDISDSVIETSWLDYEEINLFLAACNVLLLPFKRAVASDNVWPSKLNDYLSVGRPTVATDMLSLRGVFNKFQVGILTQDDPVALAQGCLELYENRDTWSRMAQNARSLAEGSLSWSTLTDRLEIFYKDLLERSITAKHG